MKKVILITGGSRGLGAVILRTLSDKEGYKVYGTSREPKTEGLLALDVTSDPSVQDCVDKVMALEGRIDVLINNVGSNLIGSLEATSMEALEEEMALNFYGAVRMIQKLLPIFRAQGQGRIINISSVGGRIPLPYNSSYAASKAALEAMSDSLAYELKGTDIHVSLVEPLGLKVEDEVPRIKKIASELPMHPQSHKLHRRMLKGVKPFDRKDLVADQVYRIIQAKKPRLRYGISAFGKLMLLAERLLPPFIIRAGIYRSIIGSENIK